MPIRSKEEVFFLSLAQDLTTKNIDFIDSLNLNEYLLPLLRP